MIRMYKREFGPKERGRVLKKGVENCRILFGSDRRKLKAHGTNIETDVDAHRAFPCAARS
jgi:hypothetical protein